MAAGERSPVAVIILVYQGHKTGIDARILPENAKLYTSARSQRTSAATLRRVKDD